MKRLDGKLARIRAGTAVAADFIIADAKDADMGRGRPASGPERDDKGRDTGAWRPWAGYLDEMRAILSDGGVDVMLTSLSSFERLGARAFAGSEVTPAIRANDSTDIWRPRGGRYRAAPSRPFRTASLARARDLGCDLALYSVTFNNDAEADGRGLEAFAAFREEALAVGMRYFLEVFNPNVECGLASGGVGAFVNDCILRALAGLTEAERPRFLKIAFNGARSMRELCSWDRELVVGVLGGAAGTHRDTFQLLAEARGCGAWVALFGRKIKLAESPLDIVRLMRDVTDGALAPDAAVRAYHERLERKGIEPARPLAEDLEITDPALKAEI